MSESLTVDEMTPGSYRIRSNDDSERRVLKPITVYICKDVKMFYFDDLPHLKQVLEEWVEYWDFLPPRAAGQRKGVTT